MTEVAHRAQTALTITDGQAEFNQMQLAALQQIGVDTNRPGDVAVFFHQAKRTGLDPFNREIYMITRKGKPTIQTGIDGFYKIANRASRSAGGTWGIPETLWCGEDGQWRDVWLSKQAPAAAKVTVERDGSKFTTVALTSEYKAQGPLWDKMPARMIAKCAEALGIRKAFPDDLSGLYTSEEMMQADTGQHGAGGGQQPSKFGIAGNMRAQPQQRTEVMEAEVVEDRPQPSTKTQWSLAAKLMQDMSISSPGEMGAEMRAWAKEEGITRELGSMKDLTSEEASQFVNYLETTAANTTTGELPAEDGQQSWQATEVPE